MLKISKNSWHYRLWQFGRTGHYQPHNLCKYFWHIALIKLLLPAVLASLVLVGIGALIWLIWGHPVESAVTVLSVFGAVLAIIGLAKLIAVIVERRREAALLQPSVPKPKKQPGVIRTFLKARKQKVCPLIEVVDE